MLNFFIYVIRWTQHESQHITNWGDLNWENSFCDGDQKIIGFRTKFEQYLENMVNIPEKKNDNTMLNSIKLICEDNSEIKSREGYWGEWSEPVKCPENTYLNGFKLKVEPPRENGIDDTATNDIIMFCNGTQLISKHYDYKNFDVRAALFRYLAGNAQRRLGDIGICEIYDRPNDQYLSAVVVYQNVALHSLAIQIFDRQIFNF